MPRYIHKKISSWYRIQNSVKTCPHYTPVISTPFSRWKIFNPLDVKPSNILLMSPKGVHIFCDISCKKLFFPVFRTVFLFFSKPNNKYEKIVKMPRPIIVNKSLIKTCIVSEKSQKITKYVSSHQMTLQVLKLYRNNFS